MSTKCRFAFTLALICCCGIAAGQDLVLLPNGSFADGLKGWVCRPGDESQVSISTGGGNRDTVLQLKPDGRLLGVETERLKFGGNLTAGRAYEVQAGLRFEGLDSGVFALSMYCFDAQGKPLKQIAFYSLSTSSPAHDWRKPRGTFGPGTRNPLPEGTQSVCIRFSFYEASGDCRGSVAVDDVVLQPYQPPEHEGWPSEVVADIGDLQVRFESRSFWTLYRIEWKRSAEDRPLGPLVGCLRRTVRQRCCYVRAGCSGGRRLANALLGRPQRLSQALPGYDPGPYRSCQPRVHLSRRDGAVRGKSRTVEEGSCSRCGIL